MNLVAMATATVYNDKDNSAVTEKQAVYGHEDVHNAVAAARRALNGSRSEFTGLQNANAC